MMKHRLSRSFLLITGVLLTTVMGSAQVINCPSGFNTNTTASGACGVSPNDSGADFFSNHSSTILDGSAEIVAPTNAGHAGNSLIKQAQVNVQAFTTTFTFIPNGGNIAFVVENAPRAGIYGMNPNIFSAGAGGEGGFSQFAGGNNTAPSKVFAMQFDSYNQMTQANWGFTYSSVQIYQPMQFPSLPISGGSGSTYLPEYSTDKISTSPVPLNSPATTPDAPSGHTYSATLTYDGYTLTLKMFDVTDGGSCPGSACFTQSWTGVYIPEIVGSNTAYVGFTAGTSEDGLPLGQAEVQSLVYTENAPTGTPTFTAWNASSTTSTGSATSSASPVYSVAPGTYSGTQSVSISTSTSPHNYICYTLSASTPAFYPHPDSNGGCTTGTLYAGPVSVSSTATLYAMAGANNSAFPLGSANPVGLGPPSTLVAGTYTIGSGSTTAAGPSFSPAGGTFTSTQSVALATTTPGAVICYSTTGTPKTNGSTGCTTGTQFASPISVASSETIYAVAGGTGFTDSAVTSSNYVIQLPPTAVATTTTLSSSTPHLINGQLALITATVTPASGAAATGTVSFYIGSQLLGIAPVLNGQATFAGAVSTQPGTYQVTATYNGSSLDNKSTSAPLTVTVVATTAIGISLNLTQLIEGSPVAISATVTSQFGTAAPTGSVAFYLGTTGVGTQQLSSGKAMDSAQINLPAGVYAVTAVYSGDGNDESSTSDSLTLTVLAPVVPQVSTNTVLSISPAQPTAGQSMVLSALVTAASGSTPTGVVNFYLGQTQIGSANLTSGAASVSVSAPSASGSYRLTAVYTGTSTDSSSSAAPLTITIAPSISTTTTSLVSSAQQVIQGQSLALSATVASKGSSDPTGTVSFYLGQTRLGSVALAGGQASWTGPASFAVGSYQVTAVYSGDTLDSGSTSSALPLAIIADPASQKFDTMTALTVNPRQATAGQSVSLSIQVAEQSGSSTPTGSVAIYLGQTEIGTAVLANGSASLSITAPVAGSYTLTAIYAGAGQNLSSQSQAMPLTVIADPVAQTFNTVTALIVSPQQVNAGQRISLSVQVAEQGGTSTPTGSVAMYLGKTQLGTALLTNGAASLSVAAPAAGAYTLTAIYAGAGQDLASQSKAMPLTVIADPAPQTFNTVTALTVNPQQATAGQYISLSVQVAEQGGTSTPAGSVAMYLGQTQIGTALLTNGSAAISVAAPAAGTYTLTAVYAGAGQDLTSQSKAVPFTVIADPVAQSFNTVTALTVNPQQATAGQYISLSVQVAEQGGTSTPTGSVAMYLGLTKIGTALLTNGSAAISVAAPAAGTYTLTAIYAGAGQDLTSQSKAIPLTVIADPASQTFNTFTALTVNPQQVTAGQSLSLSVQVAEQGGTSIPTGSVAMYLGQTQIGTALLANGSATLSIAAPAAGTYTLTAIYAGAGQDNTSTSPEVPLTVTAVATTTPQTFNTVTALTVSPQQITAGQSMNLAVQVAEQAGSSMPTGSVTLYLGETSLGTTLLTNGQASLSMVAPAAGTYTLAATYAGAGQDLASQSPTVTLVVNAATNTVPVTPPTQSGNGSFTVGLSNNTVSLTQGQSASLQVSLLAVQGYQGAVQLSCSGLPAGVACNFAPATVSLQASSANSMLSISSTSTTARNTAMLPALTYGMLAPWNLIGLLGIASGRRRRKANFGMMLMLLFAASAGLFAMTGCGVSVQSLSQPYQVSVTAVGANQQSQTQSFTLTITGPAANF